jgi:hypothetical protein
MHDLYSTVHRDYTHNVSFSPTGLVAPQSPAQALMQLHQHWNGNPHPAKGFRTKLSHRKSSRLTDAGETETEQNMH